MKRPVTLLCLSDLHLINGHSGRLAIDQLQRTLHRLATSDYRLRPDYIVIAGDLIDAKEEKKHKIKFDAVRSWIERLRTDPLINLPKFNVIAVPGNHDKQLYSSKSRNNNRELTLLNAMNSRSKIDWNTITLFDYNFLPFGTFYQYYLDNEGCDSCFFKPSLAPPESDQSRRPSVETTSGIKVFSQDRICFLCINTEWFYSQAETPREIRLCTPLVYNSLKEIRLKYPDFTIVTIMHRNPTSLSWEERNGNSANMPDILRFLYTYSDIIIAGHEHTERLLPPHRMINRAQLFQLGSVSTENRENTIPRYHAALLYLDPIRRTVKSYDLAYENFVGKWLINEPGLFALADKYTLNASDTLEETFTLVQAKSLDESEIKKALIGSFPGLQGSNFSIMCIDIKKERREDVTTSISENIKVKKNGRLFVALYATDAVDDPMLQETILEINKTFRSEIIRQRVVVNGVRIVVPLIANEPI